MLMCGFNKTPSNVQLYCIASTNIKHALHAIILLSTDIPDAIPGDDIKQISNTVTTIVVEWPVPNYYNAPITKYQLMLCQKTNTAAGCVGSVSRIVDASSDDSTVRYG